MTDEWFSEFTFQVVLGPEDLPSEKAILAKELLHSKPTVLPPWDPMGTLAYMDLPTRF